MRRLLARRVVSGAVPVALLLAAAIGCHVVTLEEQKSAIRHSDFRLHVLSPEAFLETWGDPTYSHLEQMQFYPVKNGSYVPRFRTAPAEPPPDWREAQIVSEPGLFFVYADREELLAFIDGRLVYREHLPAEDLHKIAKTWKYEGQFKTRLETGSVSPSKP
ncbi:hypothetical protein [Candidatus Nitrospira bockiana]